MTLFEFIKTDKSATKIFGKSEINIIKKQLLGLNLSQSEKNRLSRDIRLKFEFIKKCSVYKEEFKIKKGGEVYKQLELLRDTMLLDGYGKNLKKIYIFGSFVKNQMSFESDVDISVEFSKTNLKDSSFFKKRMMSESNELFDISIFNNLPKKIQDEVKLNGKIFYENK
ncbi:nucleotidyltransferase domain-containing protein [Candidatus Woesearchaeota archaeon]|nr:nucleotidyltransferase domain-containing protein [Candidatus Woesearchaeota archaeon]MCF8013073.1 nucleotidyltransferase domain-containing protein [Candidatus Woesearchaeota archaeon]